MPISSAVLARTKRPPPTEEVLRYLVGKNGSFYYEIVMMESAFKRWEALQILRVQREAEGALLHDDEKVSLNFAIEAFLTHFRNLRDFFYPNENVWSNSRWHDNAVAWDYSPLWNRADSEWVELSPNERERINKLLSHIAYARPGLSHDWSTLPKMYRAILKALDDLVATLPHERRGWFSDLLGQ
jgi:hypothetical protein